MISHFYRLMTPIFQDDDQLRVVSRLNLATAATLALGIVYGVIFLFFPRSVISPVLSVLLLMLAGVTFLLVRWGYVRIAGPVMVVLIWVIFTAPGFIARNPEFGFDFSLQGYLFPILLATILIEKEAGIVLAALSALAGLLMIERSFAAGAGDGMRATLVLDWASQSTIYFITAIVLSLVNRNIQNTIERAREGERDVTERNRQLFKEIQERQQIQDQLRRREESARQFQEKLKVLHEVSIELSSTALLKDVLRKAIELGRSQLGFDRMGLFLLEEEGRVMVGAFGTDTQGNIRDERAFQLRLTEDDNWVWESLNNKQRMSVRLDVPLYDEQQVVGHGWNAMVSLWNGTQSMGWLAVDNLIRQEPLEDYQIEILAIYGSILGHLYMQKRAEQDLRHNQEQFRVALQAAQMRTWDWRLDTDQIIRQAPSLLGPALTTFQTFLSDIHPDDKDRIWKTIRQCIAERRIYTAEYRFNTTELGYRWFYTVGQVYTDASGEVIGMAGVTQDITERKQTEVALKRTEERFQKAFHANPSAISITTLKEGRYVDVNESWLELFEYTRDEVIGRTADDLLTWDEPGSALRLAEALHEQGSIQSVEVVRRTKSGKRIYLLRSGEEIEIGGEVYFLAMSQDISERKQAEQRALELRLERERVELLKEFIGNISHDVKAPLTVITNSLHLLEHSSDTQRQQKQVERIKDQTMLLDRYIQDALTMSRLDHSPEPNFKPVELNQLVREIENRFRASVEQKQITVNLKMSEIDCLVMGEPADLDRALVNLIENAVNYTPEGGFVTIRCQEQGEDVMIEVSDTGIGVPAEDIPHIFDRFYRSEKARSTVKSGTGLGLAIVKKIVDMHKGRIEVESPAGAGTTFRLYLKRETPVHS